MSGFVRTVLGDVDPSTLGDTNYHEHLFQVSPLLAGDELEDETLSRLEATTLRAAGTGAMVEATPYGLGRRPHAVARISQATGLKIIHATGAHRGAHYLPNHPVLTATEAEMASRFEREVDYGFTDDLGELIGGKIIRAGVIKAGIEYWRIAGFERRVVVATAVAARATGAPLMIHLEHGSAAHEVLDLFEAEGIPAARIALAHIDRNLDPALHVELAGRGAKLGYDGWGRHREAPDSAILKCLERVVSTPAGAHAVLLGGDVARASRYRAYGGIPGLDYLARRMRPRIEAGIGAAAFDVLLKENPAQWLQFVSPIS